MQDSLGFLLGESASRRSIARSVGGGSAEPRPTARYEPCRDARDLGTKLPLDRADPPSRRSVQNLEHYDLAHRWTAPVPRVVVDDLVVHAPQPERPIRDLVVDRTSELEEVGVCSSDTTLGAGGATRRKRAEPSDVPLVRRPPGAPGQCTANRVDVHLLDCRASISAKQRSNVARARTLDDARRPRRGADLRLPTWEVPTNTLNGHARRGSENLEAVAVEPVGRTSKRDLSDKVSQKPGAGKVPHEARHGCVVGFSWRHGTRCSPSRGWHASASHASVPRAVGRVHARSPYPRADRDAHRSLRHPSRRVSRPYTPQASTGPLTSGSRTRTTSGWPRPLVPRRVPGREREGRAGCGVAD